MCLFVCAVDHGVTEEEPVDEQYRKQVCEDQYRGLEPEGQYLDQDFSEGFENGQSHPLMHILSQFYKHNLLACFQNCILFCC